MRGFGLGGCFGIGAIIAQHPRHVRLDRAQADMDHIVLPCLELVGNADAFKAGIVIDARKAADRDLGRDFE